MTLMLQRHLSSTLRAFAIASSFALACVFCLPLPAQSGQAGSLDGLINRLLPDGAPPSDLQVNPDQRERIITKLKAAQSRAHGLRAQQLAFILATLNVGIGKNRDYLFHA